MRCIAWPGHKISNEGDCKSVTWRNLFAFFFFWVFIFSCKCAITLYISSLKFLFHIANILCHQTFLPYNFKFNAFSHLHIWASAMLRKPFPAQNVFNNSLMFSSSILRISSSHLKKKKLNRNGIYWKGWMNNRSSLIFS